MSSSPIYLKSIAAVGSEAVNLNLLTTLIAPRVKKLMAEGLSLKDAESQAQNELLQSFGYTGQEYDSFSAMNISGTSKSDAILLAASCLIQEDRTTGEVQAMINKIASELESNGSLSEEVKNQIYDNVDYIDIWDITNYLIEYYTEQNVKDYDIPPFYIVLNEEYAEGIHFINKYIYSDPGLIDGCNTSKKRQTRTNIVLCTQDFDVVSDCDWINVYKNHIIADFYQIEYTIDENQGDIRSGNIRYMLGSEIAYEDNIRQMFGGGRLYVTLPSSGTKASIEQIKGFEVGEEIEVNGEIYTLQKDEYGFYVRILDSPTTYSVCYPVKATTVDQDGNEVSFTPMKSYADDFYYSTITYPTTGYSNGAYPFYCPTINSGEISQAKLEPCFVGLIFEIEGAEVKDNVITITADQNMFGTFLYSPYISESELFLNPDAVSRDHVTSDGTNEAIIKLDETNTSPMLLIPPQNYSFRHYERNIRKMTVSLDFIVEGQVSGKNIDLPITDYLSEAGRVIVIKLTPNSSSYSIMSL